jgi:glycerol-3-phosphate dehydrogenase
MSQIAVIGAGTWGIALANMLSEKHNVTVYSAIGDEIDYIQKYHKHPHLENVSISQKIYLTKELKETVENNEIIVMAVPSIYVRSTSKQIAQYIKDNQIIVDVAKGIEADSLKTMSEIIYEEISKQKSFSYSNVVALSGPTHAEEVSVGMPTTIVSCSTDEEIAKKVQEIFTSDYMRVYTNNDIKGVEICGALKNIIALAAGISRGLGFGDNAVAALVTRGIHEMARLGIAMDCSIHTFYGLAGIGDLVVTCTSMHSRNNKCGMYIGQGLSVNEAIEKVGMVVEGINALDAAYKLSKIYNVELPIINCVYDVVKNNVKPIDSVKKLYERDLKSETFHIEQ